MVYDQSFGDRARCTGRDAEECRALVLTLSDMTEKARAQGLLALEDDIEEMDSPMLRIGTQLVVDGTDPDLVRGILERIVLFGGHKGKELLSRCIILEGLLALQRGDHPWLVEAQLLSFLGESAITEENLRKEQERDGGYQQLISDLQGQPAASTATSETEEELLGLDDRSIQKMLRQVDSTVLSGFLVGASGDMRARIYRNMSPKSVKMVDGEIRYLGAPDPAAVRESADALLAVVARLRELGEIG